MKNHKHNIQKYRRILNYLFSYIVPECKQENMPSASFLLNNQIIFSEDDYQLIDEAIKLLNKYSSTKYNVKIEKLSDEKIIDIIVLFKLGSSRVFYSVVNLVLQLYYCNEDVLAKIISKSLPPFPEGNKIKETDLLIFESTYLRDKIYRE